MILFLVSFVSLLFFTSAAKPVPSWAREMRLVLILSCSELAELALTWLHSWRSLATRAVRSSQPENKEKNLAKTVAPHSIPSTAQGTNLLDLHGLPLDCILERLPAEGLSRMACVCRATRGACRKDHLWEMHFRRKWGQVFGEAGFRRWEASKGVVCGSASRRGLVGGAERWTEVLRCVLGFFWVGKRTGNVNSGAGRTSADEAVVELYLALERGQLWFPAQVYNRENGHVGFLLSCYDAEVAYDCGTDSFFARYPPHGRRPAKIEEGVSWDRLRAPAVDTPAQALHVSDCLDDLRPGDHVEIQWRKNKEFPYGWWYGVVGHLDLCSETSSNCLCCKNDTILVEFKQYSVGSRWRQARISRKQCSKEENGGDGFYGGIRKLKNKEEISRWKQLWPTQVLE